MNPSEVKKHLRQLEKSSPQVKLNRLKAELRDFGSKLLSELYKEVQGLSLSEAVQTIEESFQELPSTKFEPVRHFSFEQNIEPLSVYLVLFHQLVSRDFQPRAIYLEMNAFTINPEAWIVNAFAFRRRGSSRRTEWLSRWDSPDHPNYELRGVDHIRELFVRPIGHAPAPIQDSMAEAISEFLIILRFNLTVAKAHQRAVLTEPSLKEMSVFSNAHDYDLLYESVAV